MKLSGNRRRPFAVRKTNGFDERGYPVIICLGYYKTRSEALLALAEFNRTPYDVSMVHATFADVFEAWKTRDFPKMSKSSAAAHKSAYNHCKSLYTMEYKDLRTYHFQAVIDECRISTKAQIKNLFVGMDKYAYEMDIISKGYAHLVKASNAPHKPKEPFSNAEIKLLWDHRGTLEVDEILFMLYTGMRLTEMLTLKPSDINLQEQTIIGGIKTEAGKNRVIPIHHRILPLIECRMNLPCLFGRGDLNFPQGAYYKIWNGVMDELGMKHTPHDCRHSFRSELDRQGANKVAADLLMGHKSKDVGERVYTHKTLDELRDTVELVKYGL